LANSLTDRDIAGAKESFRVGIPAVLTILRLALLLIAANVHH